MDVRTEQDAWTLLWGTPPAKFWLRFLTATLRRGMTPLEGLACGLEALARVGYVVARFHGHHRGWR